ncbi:MAG: type II toxin-antitoxin system RelE/ParE family toxin [Polaromonas sp.]
MTRVVLSPDIREDFDRIFDHLFAYAPQTAGQRIEEIIAAVDILQTSPMIGRPMALGQRELVIASVSHGCLALYRYDAVANVAYVLAIRSQRELRLRPGFG